MVEGSVHVYDDGVGVDTGAVESVVSISLYTTAFPSLATAFLVDQLQPHLQYPSKTRAALSEQPGLSKCTDQGEANRPVRLPDAYLHPRLNNPSIQQCCNLQSHHRRDGNIRIDPSTGHHRPAVLPSPTVAAGVVPAFPSSKFPTRPSLHAQNTGFAGFPRYSALRHRLPRSPNGPGVLDLQELASKSQASVSPRPDPLIVHSLLHTLLP